MGNRRVVELQSGRVAKKYLKQKVHPVECLFFIPSGQKDERIKELKMKAEMLKKIKCGNKVYK